MNCPKCHTLIANEYINSKSDVAQCPNCNLKFHISDYSDFLDPNFNINITPSGTWYKENDSETIIGAKCFSFYSIFYIFFSLLWSIGSLYTIYGSQVRNKEFQPMLSIIGIPFIIASIALWIKTIISTFGKIEMTLNSEGGKIFTGVGKFGSLQTFSWQKTSKITKTEFHSRFLTHTDYQIAIIGTNILEFGKWIEEEKLDYFLQSLQLLKLYSNKVKARI